MGIVERLKQRVLRGESLTRTEIMELADTKEREALYKAAGEITCHFGKPSFNPCSIINARAGKCSENCKWCAQSGHYRTGSEVHDIVPADKVVAQAKRDEEKGVRRFCQVTSGRSVKGDALKRICENYRELGRNTHLFLCGSLGLLGREELQQLWDAGVRRYHCNLETAPSYFPHLCTTHTIEEKIETLKQAREIGFELCSGGIIGMGETRAQRVELAIALLEVQPDSIPINILSPIKGTPLSGTVPIDGEEILLTVAIFRFLHPRAELRFAGGRGRLSREVQLKALRTGINAAVVGDLLTTTGSDINGDKVLTAEAGYRLWL